MAEKETSPGIKNPKQNKKIKNNSDKPKYSIASRFGAYLSILIFIIVVFMTFYAVWTGINVIDNARMEKYTTAQLISHEIVDIYKNQLIKEKYTSFDHAVKSLIRKRIFLQAFVINNKATIKYANNPSLIGKKITDVIKSKPKKESALEKYLSLITLEKLNDPNFLNRINLPNDDSVIIDLYLGNFAQATTIYKGFVILAIIFIGCGFVSASVLAKMVTKPVQDLYKATQSFANKDWSYRIEVTSDDEIGKLAESYNAMASELSNIYESLEQKVIERTKEIEVKNKELGKAYDELKAAQVKLVHSEKMSSLGQLVAGVAHELNNPINFIYGNMEHLKNYSHDMRDLIAKYISFEENLTEEQKSEIEEIKEDIDYEYLLEDLDDLLTSCKEGAERTRQIVLDLRNFSRLDEANLKEVNIHEGIDSTLNILHNKYKDRVEIIKEYDDSIPPIYCFAGQLNQVFMNLLANASQAVEEKGEVKIITQKDDDYATIKISDTGVGIPPENLSKIFDPFFTTKDVGDGTGLGLSVTYGIIEKHNGTISVDSKVGEGTTFTVKIPIRFKNPEEKQDSNIYDFKQ